MKQGFELSVGFYRERDKGGVIWTVGLESWDWESRGLGGWTGRFVPRGTSAEVRKCGFVGRMWRVWVQVQ